ncbi:MAG: dipeptidase PepE [Acidobacteriota bacterium]|jgi:dipeptidase E
MRKILLMSNSTMHGGAYLEWPRRWVEEHLGGREALFIPYARPSGVSHDEYTEATRAALAPVGSKVSGIHRHEDPVAAVEQADAVFAGGGNTFVLLRDLYAHGLLEPLQARIAAGMPYMGASAGSNIAGLTIGTTNDMPIVYPPSFDALALVPFNINPHYLDPDPHSKHQGETREARINEFHAHNPQPVVALREGTLLRIADDGMELIGEPGGLLFRAGTEPEALADGARLDHLLET